MRRWLLHILCLLVLLPGPVSAQTSRKALESQRAQLQKDIELLNRQLEENSRSSEKTLSQLTLVRRKIAKREALIADCDKTLRILKDSIGACQQQLDKLQARHDTLSLYYARLVRGAYKNRDSRMWYMYILSSDNMGQAFRRVGYLRSLSSQMNAQAQRIHEASAALEVERERLLVLKAESDEVRAQMVRERSKLQDEETVSSRLVNRLNKDRKKYQQQLKDKNKQIEALNRKIADLIRSASSGKASSSSGSKKIGKTTSTAVDTKQAGQFAANKGKLPWPVEGVVVEQFGKHKHPVYENVDLPQNNGVTLAVKPGTQARAVFDGTVTQIFVLPGYNQCVLVSHGNYYTLYSKLKTVAVKAGTKVKTGEVIGVVDTIAGEDLFHFELWKDNTPQNPESWLQ